MLRGLVKLTYVEWKVFMREPMGAVSTFVIPAAVFLVVGKMLQRGASEEFDPDAYIGGTLPVLVAMVILLNNVTSLATILSIYREGGILKRLKATPLTPVTILSAHVLVKLLITAINIGTLILVGRSFFDVSLAGSPFNFAVAVAISAVTILSLGFIIASLVRTARFAQMTATVILYPLLAISGLFGPVAEYPIALKLAAYVSPLTHAVSLMRATWDGASWPSVGWEVAILAVSFGVCVAVSSRVFRWE